MLHSLDDRYRAISSQPTVSIPFPKPKLMIATLRIYFGVLASARVESISYVRSIEFTGGQGAVVGDGSSELGMVSVVAGPAW